MDRNNMSDKFPLPLKVINHADGSKYPFELDDDFEYHWTHNGLLRGHENTVYVIKVPKGYRTDFGSIPRILQGVFNAVNDVAYAATIHDWIYSVELFERSTCDKVFKDALQDNGVGMIRSNIFYAGVRSGGWRAWPHDPAEIYSDRELYRSRFRITAPAP